MQFLWGIIVVALSLLAWGGQLISWVSPKTAAHFSPMEPEESVTPSYWARIQGEAPFDSITLWTMVVAGLLLMLDVDAWTYFGLVGGGMYVYFAGHGLFTRVAMRRHGYQVGTAKKLRIEFAMLIVWGMMGLITIVAAVVALQTS